MNVASSEPTALHWLYSTQMFGIKLGLHNTRHLLQALDLPWRGQRFIHVAGTNGKGSTCAFMHAILRAAGINAGLFTSPHLIRFNERICDAERQISDVEIQRGLERLRLLVQDWEPHPTFFELAFVLALDWFRQRGLEWIILETGLGGRLDATNAIVPEVSVITHIGMDHMEQLGGTLAQIAAEKAGIIKPGVPVVTLPQAPEAMQVLAAKAAEQAARLTVVEEPLSEDDIGLRGVHQGWNAALALAALQMAGLEMSAAHTAEGLRSVRWQGRFQTLHGGRTVVDGAHNAAAAEALAAAWEAAYPGEKATVVFGGSTGKDLPAILSPLACIAVRWVLVEFDSPRAVRLSALRAALTQASPCAQALEASDLTQSLALAHSFPERVLVTGSLFLVGELLALLDRKTQERSAQ